MPDYRFGELNGIAANAYMTGKTIIKQRVLSETRFTTSRPEFESVGVEWDVKRHDSARATSEIKFESVDIPAERSVQTLRDTGGRTKLWASCSCRRAVQLRSP